MADKPRARARYGHMRNDIMLLIAALLIFLVAPNAPSWFERTLGNFAPVTRNTQLVQVYQFPNKKARVHLTSEKVRECSYREVYCFLGQRSGNNVPITGTDSCYFEGPPRVNGLGQLEWDNFIIGVLPEQVPDTFADVAHLCSVPGSEKPVLRVRTKWWTGSRAK